ncbi:RloB family protein [Youngiibacter multivorans]|uniref:RloB domain-containing protein n=1 Tax=Youngiibacter multivorans TaxID=937251 RepID=A0ABS4G7S1_9CLOT|nr:RloB family protein [Youngiibacter multivorans]MBP1920596.1 hypothetical protein [Youngiibacter multivorans]
MAGRINRLKRSRSERKIRPLRLGGYLIITDTEATEVNYFLGLKESIPPMLKGDLQIKVFKNKDLDNIINFASSERNKDSRFRSVWVVFDRDEVKNFDNLVSQIEKEKMNPGWSNPCFEIWLSAYFGEMKSVNSPEQCCTEFERLMKKNTNRTEYIKSDSDIYNLLVNNGSESRAIELAKERYFSRSSTYSKPSAMTSCTTVFMLVEEIMQKIQN